MIVTILLVNIYSNPVKDVLKKLFISFHVTSGLVNKFLSASFFDRDLKINLYARDGKLFRSH